MKSQAQPTCSCPSREKARPVSKSLLSTPLPSPKRGPQITSGHELVLDDMGMNIFESCVYFDVYYKK